MVEHETCYLGGIAVAPEHRRKGIARRLEEALRREAESREVDRIEPDVWLFNDEARAAFESLGFEPIAQRMRLRPEGRGDVD